MGFNSSSWSRKTVKYAELSAFLKILDAWIEYFNSQDIQGTC